MQEERILMSLGIPLVDAICLCNSLRREGTLKDFIEKEMDRVRITRSDSAEETNA